MRRSVVFPLELATVGLAIVVLATFAAHSCSRPPKDAGDGMSDSTRLVNQHLDQTDTTYLRQIREAEAAASLERTRRLAAEQSSKASHAEAQRQADLAASANSARDSATHWHLAYVSEVERGDSLQRALDHETAGGLAILKSYNEVKDRVREEEEARALLRKDLRERTAELAQAEHNAKRNLLVGLASGVILDRIILPAVSSAVSSAVHKQQ